MISTIKSIKKRDGSLVQFDLTKINSAIEKAVKAVGGEDTDRVATIARKVGSFLEVLTREGTIPSVEMVQDLVEKVLIEEGHAKVAKAYILYRQQHEEMRKARAFMKGSVQAIDAYVRQTDWRVNENANMAFSLQGLNNHLAQNITSSYWLEKVYPESVAQAHRAGDFHIHDLGMLSVYCCGWDLKDLLVKGFGKVPGKITAGPAKRFKVALGQICNFLYTLQGEAAGAQAFANFDTLLAPFVRNDGLSYKEVKQAMQEFIFNMNVPTRVGFQTPFTNITLDLVCPANMRSEAVVIGGKLQDGTYGEFQAEMDLINRAFCEVMMEGDYEGRIFSFPIPTYNLTKDVDWYGERMKPVWEMTAKYGIPYFSNFINSDMSPDDARSMCCRLRLDNTELRRRGGGLFGSNPLTGSVGVVTLNLPRAAYLSENEDAFFSRIARLMDLAKMSLEIKRKQLEDLTDDGLYPYSRVYLQGIKDRSGSYWDNHFDTIGLIGMHEALLNLIGKGIDTPEGKAYAEKTMHFMRDRIREYQDETGSLFNLEATPGEGTTYRLASKDRKDFPDIITSGKDEPYYTNSTQLPVDATEDIFEALKHQDTLQSLYTGGTVLHGFLGERIEDWRTVAGLARKIAHGFHLPYFSFTPTFSICPQHGYLTGEHFQCPTCGSDAEVWSRVVGFYRPVQQWNKGKKEEYRDRREFLPNDKAGKAAA